MHTRTQEYVELFFATFKQLVHKEFSYLRQKNTCYAQNDLLNIEQIIMKQREEFTILLKHSYFFTQHVELIIGELGFSSKNKFDSTVFKKFEDLLFKENFLLGFILSHSNQFLKILDKQLLSLNNSQGFVNKMRYGKLIRHLEKEEELYNEFLVLFIGRIEYLERLTKYETKHELIQKVENYVLGAAVAITTVPLGPLELVSIPFWGTYLALHEWQKHSREFEQWRRIEKKRIIKDSSPKKRFFKMKS